MKVLSGDSESWSFLQDRSSKLAVAGLKPGAHFVSVAYRMLTILICKCFHEHIAWCASLRNRGSGNMHAFIK